MLLMNSYKKQLEEALKIEGESFSGSKTSPAKTGSFTEQKKGLIKKGPLNRKEKITFGVALASILLIGGGLLFWMSTQKGGDIVSIITPRQKPPVEYFSPLNGLQVADEAATKRAVTAVMIENSPDARPQSGLAEADVVFEAVAEGGITRFIALYQPSRPSLIGPVRSLRAYYAEWASSFNPGVAHVGGSGDALAMVRSGDYGVDLDQFFNAGAYWRARDRAAPHNMYTSSENLDELNNAKGHKTSEFTFAPRINEKAVETPTASHIAIDVSTGIFSVSYDYNSETNSYHRKQGGAPHTDREKGQISPKVVIALKTNISMASDRLHMNIATSGTGQAYVFQNGIVVEGTWSKDSHKERLIIKDSEGKEIKLVRGQTWITTVGNDRNVSWQ